MTKVIIAGAKGRMGQALVRCAQNIPGLTVAGQIDVGDDLQKVIAGADAVIDFTFHETTTGLARVCAEHRKAIVIGTTGHTKSESEELLALSAQIPMVWSANFSTGVNVLFWLTRKAAEILGPEYDLEVVEMHHRLKKDAPSGTAMALAKILTEARQQSLDESLRHGREGLVGARVSTEIGMHSIRGGDVVGDHTVMFATTGERLELTHKASSRDAFAVGALRAAQWVVGKKSGLYDMQNVLGLKP
ncbi:MAG TPA: 4-hydroxy-tetrahydrodipicolinate reductase [Verrucomicrobiae bacterium]|jgi:4-hydroxy-tetrahydrodipicolinate reductase